MRRLAGAGRALHVSDPIGARETTFRSIDIPVGRSRGFARNAIG
ncbi:hypothetical protein C7S16_6984 [Burkholderia thailandensis]|uniref:Uncharacterized protein n=1 Tax=Burkholderia thailandensis TaxID=57975 RepID=A0AAW9CP62_BURTH|nr:hypothetical protein [Burkholderia thailandensis]MDW9252760.1 hypothetical protein [Burkholderia thailandensis]